MPEDFDDEDAQPGFEPSEPDGGDDAFDDFLADTVDDFLGAPEDADDEELEAPEPKPVPSKDTFKPPSAKTRAVPKPTPPSSPPPPRGSLGLKGKGKVGGENGKALVPRPPPKIG